MHLQDHSNNTASLVLIGGISHSALVGLVPAAQLSVESERIRISRAGTGPNPSESGETSKSKRKAKLGSRGRCLEARVVTCIDWLSWEIIEVE